MSRELIPEIIGKNVQTYRMKAKLTQDELAELAGISTPFLANIENGYKGVSVNTLCRLSAALGTSTDSLLFEESPSSHKDNIAALLDGQPEQMAAAVESIVRFFIDQMETLSK